MMDERNTITEERNAVRMERKTPNEMRVAKRCPYCGKRLFDKITMGSGVVETKCPQCKNVVQFDLAFRRARRGSSYVPKMTINF